MASNSIARIPGACLAAPNSLDSGLITVGVVSTAKYLAPRMLAAFTRTHPGINIERMAGNREETIAAFTAGRYDLRDFGR